MYKVSKQSAHTWGIYRGADLVEGGFFSRAAADAACAEWNAGTR